MRSILILAIIFNLFNKNFTQEITNNIDTNKILELKPDVSALDFFKKVRNSVLNNLPDKFTGRLTGKLIKNKLDTIPKEYIEKDKTPYVQITFSKKDGVNIEVKNVDELYKNLFQQYVRVFTLGPILIQQKDDSYLDKYIITYKYLQENSVILNLQIKGSENNILIYADRKSYRIFRIDYALGEKLQTSTIIRFINYETNKNKYIIPDRFLTKSFQGQEQLPDVFDVEDIKIY